MQSALKLKTYLGAWHSATVTLALCPRSFALIPCGTSTVNQKPMCSLGQSAPATVWSLVRAALCTVRRRVPVRKMGFRYQGVSVPGIIAGDSQSNRASVTAGSARAARYQVSLMGEARPPRPAAGSRSAAARGRTGMPSVGD